MVEEVKVELWRRRRERDGGGKRIGMEEEDGREMEGQKERDGGCEGTGMEGVEGKGWKKQKGEGRREWRRGTDGAEEDRLGADRKG